MRSVLTRAERLVAAAAGVVLATAVVSTSWADAPEPVEVVAIIATALAHGRQERERRR